MLHNSKVARLQFTLKVGVEYRFFYYMLFSIALFLTKHILPIKAEPGGLRKLVNFPPSRQLF